MEGYHDDDKMEEINPLDQPGDNNLEMMEFDVDGEVTDCTGLGLRQVQNTSERNMTNNSSQLDIYITELYINKICLQCSHGCDCKTNKMKEWLIDSGASEHFTYDINSFVDYEELKNHSSVKTANSTAEVRGRGTVIIVLTTGDVVRINPVYHVPTLSCQLLAMGKFLQSGYTSTGNSTSIRIMKGSGTFLTFNPRREKDSLYVIKSLKPDETDIHMALNTIYGVDFDIIHRRLVHPSKEVLLKARKHLKDFPEIDFPKEEHLCPGCMQGKMSNRSFPPSTRRASQPFELIHSDLKLFPIDSYHKFRYVIVFLDDFTSAAWTLNLRTKDAALTATFQFIELVKNKFNSTIIQWMSDAGGE